MNKTELLQHNPKLDLVIKRTMNAPVDLVWRALTEPELLKRWFAPRPWTVGSVTLELVPGGAFGVSMHGPAGEVFEESPGAFWSLKGNQSWCGRQRWDRGFGRDKMISNSRR
jgi:hypothetical protein